jgi:hypothetical protein
MYGGGPPVADLTEILASVYADPQVVGTAIPDLHLKPGSPAIQAGAPIGAIAVFGIDNSGRDHDGLPRGTTPAIGAYEIAGSSGSPQVTINPPLASLQAGQPQQFSATVEGAGNTAVTWSMSPIFGTLSSSGLYTPPASVPNPESIAVTATSMADSNASATATAVVNPAKVSLTVSPPSALLGPSQIAQFTAIVSGAADTAVTWTSSPAVGTLSASGLYTAPASITTAQSLTVTATSVADSTKSAAAAITLQPPGQYAISFTQMGSTSVQVNWTAPGSGTANDWIGLSSVAAPSYWYTWSQTTNGAAMGSIVLNLPASTGLWEFRYYLGKTYRIAAVSPKLAVGVSGFGVNASTDTVAAGAPFSVAWTAPAGRPAGDLVGLFAQGATNLHPSVVQYLSGSAGTFTMIAPSAAGQYRLRYQLGGSWVTAALGPLITVR